jgi:excisionase family DNA binding protein
MRMAVAIETHREMLADGLSTVREAAVYSRLSRAFLYNAMERGDLVYVKVGRRRLIPKRALLEFLARGLRGS